MMNHPITDLRRLLAAAALATAAFSLPSLPAAAEDAVAKGTKIAEEWDRRDHGFGDSRQLTKMVLENAHGETSIREMRLDTLEVPGDDNGDKSLVIFDQPRDVKGTAFLTFSNILEPDDQWLYLPALKRVKRISSKNKSGPFVGSEFAYEDISSLELKKYTYKWLRDEACGDLECFVLEQTPQYPDSGYTRTLVWYDKAEYRIRKIDFFDRKNELLKTLAYSDFRQYLGQYWRAHDLYMVNHQTGKKTRLTIDEITFRNGFAESDFSQNALKRAY